MSKTAKKVTHQKVTAILNAAGFEPRRKEWQDKGDRRVLVTVWGYSARQFGKEVGVDCGGIYDQMPAIIEALQAQGLNAREKFPGGGMVAVSA